ASMSAPKRARGGPARRDREARLRIRPRNNTRSLAFMAFASSLALLAGRHQPRLRSHGRSGSARGGIGEDLGLAGEAYDFEAERVPAPYLGIFRRRAVGVLECGNPVTVVLPAVIPLTLDREIADLREILDTVCALEEAHVLDPHGDGTPVLMH